MKDMDLEIATEYEAAAIALIACKKINPVNPLAVAENIPAMWGLLERALCPIEVEAARREMLLAPGKSDYYREMHDLADAIHEIAIKILKGGAGCRE